MDFAKKKLLNAIIFFAIMAAMFFAINKLNSTRDAFVISFSFEEQIPLIPFFSVIYASAWPFFIFPFLASKNEEELKRVRMLFYTVTIINCLIFLLFPIKADGWEQRADGNSIFSWLLNTIKENDLPYNAFPSLHASLATLSFIFLNYQIRNKNKIAFLWAWYILILASVLFTKQHNLLDVPSGIGLATLIFYINNYFRKRKLP